MPSRISILAAALIGGVLGGCASSDDPPPSCRGALRPANPYGSVLQSTSPSAPTQGSPGPAASWLGTEGRSDRGQEPSRCGGPPS
jgi:hypothetical protein